MSPAPTATTRRRISGRLGWGGAQARAPEAFGTSVKQLTSTSQSVLVFVGRRVVSITVRLESWARLARRSAPGETASASTGAECTLQENASGACSCFPDREAVGPPLPGLSSAPSGSESSSVPGCFWGIDTARSASSTCTTPPSVPTAIRGESWEPAHPAAASPRYQTATMSLRMSPSTFCVRHMRTLPSSLHAAIRDFDSAAIPVIGPLKKSACLITDVFSPGAPGPTDSSGTASTTKIAPVTEPSANF
mmetsp:Transcript_11849/g.28116  ORF Transcript_11849/g.28116 Transcript_11849/m.28116 type:complete len:250 (+) Transcript_11849:2-751(+)